MTGCYTAAHLSNKGMDVSVLAREGIQFRDGITGEEHTVHLPILTAPVKQEFHIAMAWHWCHVALILPLAGLAYSHKGDLEAFASDNSLLKKSIRTVAQGFDVIKRNGYPT